MWPFRSRPTAHEEQADARLAALDDRIGLARATVEHNASRVDSARSRAERAAARRARAIEENHLDQLFIRDLRGGTP